MKSDVRTWISCTTALTVSLLASFSLPEKSHASGTFSIVHCGEPTPTPSPRPTATPSCPKGGIVPSSPESTGNGGCPTARKVVIAQCRSFEITGGKNRELRSNWRLDNFLWKPIAEHYNGLVVVTLPRGQATSVKYWSADKRIKGRFNVKFRSVGDAGDAWADFNRNGKAIAKQFGPVVVEVRSRSAKTRRFLIQCPELRSDGQAS